MKKPEVFIEKIASGSSFYMFIDLNKEELGFDHDEFHSATVTKEYNEGNLTSRWTLDFAKKILNKEGHAGNSYWDDYRPYVKAVIAFMETYELETIRFEADW